MKCPACANNLTEVKVGEVNVDICKDGCGGIWFDQFELKKFDEKSEAAGQELLDSGHHKAVAVDPDKRYSCPRCSDDIIMMRHFFSVKKSVVVDECPACGGFWLDYGELGQIRDLFETEQERHEAADKYFHELFGEKLESKKQEVEGKMAKTISIFRFICPSYYMEGKQDWGAY